MGTGLSVSFRLAAPSFLSALAFFGCVAPRAPEARSPGESAPVSEPSGGGSARPGNSAEAPDPAASRQQVRAPQRAIPFARVGAKVLSLDLYLPVEEPPVGVIVWVHGGAWRAGSRESVDLAPMTLRGWAVASVDYRLSTEARFPAQVHDIKAAARFLRGRADDFGLPNAPYVIAGASAGGHLAALVGVTASHPELEGEVGLSSSGPAYLDESSAFQAIVDFYGASNLATILEQSSQHGLEVRIPALQLLLGGQPSQLPELARLASPVAHVGAGDPPLFLVHGDADPQMPVEQAYELREAYKRQGLPVRMTVLRGQGHGGPAFVLPSLLDEVDAFLRAQLGCEK